MQPDGRLVQHIAHALQVTAQLRRQTDALRLAAAQRRRAAVQRQVAQAHLFEKLQPAADFGHQVAGNVCLASAHAAGHLQRLHPLAHLCHRQAGNLGNRPATHRPLRTVAELHMAGRRVQAGAAAGGADLVVQVFDVGFGEGLLPALAVFIFHRVIKHLALFFGQRHAGAYAIGAPSVLAVVGEKARVQLGIRGGAHRAGPLGRKHLHLAHAGG